ncbi:hypothetical protein R1sor_026588 [Riccia sorocarpa]|uniref:Fatty acid hydroxylase domain-containing protein n=1 Tax=Riccia sorocarpa TaxID=122646 RepID=A0ABD3GEY3_9MARC
MAGGSFTSMTPGLLHSVSPLSNLSDDLNGSRNFSERMSAPHGAVTDTIPFLSRALVTTAVGIVAGCLISAAHGFLEFTLFHLIEYLGRIGKARRLAPSFPVTMNNYRKEDFFAVAFWLMPLSAFAYTNRQIYAEKMKFSGDILGCWLYAFTMMVLHDTYFYTVHSLMHRVKALFSTFHAGHHTTRGDLTVYATAFGDPFEPALTFAPFYFAVFYYYAHENVSWDPVAWVMLLWALNMVDMIGHCGYDLPVWVFGPASSGVLLVPLAQRSKHHYIHHLDPRFNRALYFTWWDRLGGTFKEHHPKVEEKRDSGENPVAD